MVFNFANEQAVRHRTNGFTRVRAGAGSTIDGVVVSQTEQRFFAGTELETSGATIGIRDHSGVVHNVDVYGPLLRQHKAGVPVHYVDHARDGLLVQEVVAGKFGYGAPVEHATPLKSIRSY